jgi:hypothetical protein
MNVLFRVPNRIAAAVLTVLALVVTSLPSPISQVWPSSLIPISSTRGAFR